MHHPATREPKFESIRTQRERRQPENQGHYGHMGKQYGHMGKQHGHLGAADRDVNRRGGEYGHLGKEHGHLGAADVGLNRLGAWRTHALKQGMTWCCYCGERALACRHVPHGFYERCDARGKLERERKCPRRR